MAIVNRIDIECSGSLVSYPINLIDTDDAGINAVLATIPASSGTYVYSHNLSGGSVSSVLDIQNSNGCISTLYKDNIAYSSVGSCCISIDPADLVSSDLPNILSIGTDGKLVVTEGMDIFVNGGTLNPSTFEITLVDNDGVTPDVVIQLNKLRQTTADITVNGTTYPIGTDFETILNALNAIAHVPAVVTNNAAPYSFDSATQTLNVPQVPTIVNGQLLQGDGTAPEDIPDNWRVGRGANGSLPDGVNDDTEDIGHRSDIFVGADALVTVGHGGGDIASNTALGNYALESNTTGSLNTANGISSLFSNTTGTNNTATGSYSLAFNTTGIQNTATGVSSLYSNTTGSFNTATGQNSLYSNTTGTNNTATGISSLFSNTTGINNTANGISSLFSNTTGTDNTATGSYSLVFNTTGIQNTAIGQNSLYSNTTGSLNTATGQGSLFSNTTGTNNTATGQNSLFSNTTGINNTANGMESLLYSQENENTSIGSNSFNSSNLLLSGATINASTSTQVTLSAPMTPSPAVGSYVTLVTIAGYTSTISGLSIPKSYRVINDTTLEVTDPSQVLGTTGTATNFEIRSSLGYTNSSALGFNAEPTASNQVKLGDTRVTEINLGNNLIIDVAAILGAADGTPLVKRLTGGIHYITI